MALLRCRGRVGEGLVASPCLALVRVLLVGPVLDELRPRAVLTAGWFWAAITWQWCVPPASQPLQHCPEPQHFGHCTCTAQVLRACTAWITAAQQHLWSCGVIGGGAVAVAASFPASGVGGARLSSSKHCGLPAATASGCGGG